jgi:triacylglycerol esterase/lipase EstA (alpha/beta hydrolase family)
VTDRPPVILLPGAFGQEIVYWNAWQWFLERDGFHVYLASFPRFTFHDLRVSARHLAGKVEEVRAVEGAERVALVGHSMGGLIARWYVKFLDGAPHVSRLCCLGVPHHGTWTAATAPVLTGTRQILPGSPFLDELNNGADHGGVPILNIWSKWDGIVVPAQSALLEMPGVENRAIPFAGHWGLLVSRKAYQSVREALETDATPGVGRS